MRQARCVKASRGEDPPNTKRHTENQRKAHHSIRHTQKCPRAASSHEVCPCTYTLCVPPQAQQAINKETYLPTNKQQPRAPRRRPNTNKQSKTTRQHRVDAMRTCRPPKQVCLPHEGREPWCATHKGKGTTTTPPPTREHARYHPPQAYDEDAMREARCVRTTRGGDPPNAKRDTEEQRKAHHTMKHTQECPRLPSGHEVCPCTHAPGEPPQAQQGINKETYPPPNKQPPGASRRHPTTHACFLCSLCSRPPAWKEAWSEGHPHVTESREPHATGERTTATKHTYHKLKGTKRARGMPTHTRVRQTS